MAWLILYGLSIALSKCAILLLYLRVFTTSNRAFTTCVYLMGSVVVATGIANTFAAVFQCSPVAYAWNKSLQGGHCIDEVAFARSMTLPNVVTGAIMLVVPLPLSWRLNLTLSARVALTATFLHGIMYVGPHVATHPSENHDSRLQQWLRRELRPPHHLLPHQPVRLLKR